jgi:hypothetical protein
MDVVAVADLVEEELGGRSPQVTARLPNRGERDGRGAGEDDVVVADDGQLLGYADACCDALLQEPESDQVVGAEGRTRSGGARHAGHALTRPASLRDRQGLGADDDKVLVGTAGCRPRVPGARQSVAHLADALRATDERDSFVAQVEEVLDRQFATQYVVDCHGAVGGDVSDPVDDDDGGAPAGHLVERGVVRVQRGDEDALDALLLQPSEVGPLALSPVRAVAQEEREVVPLHGVLDSLGDVGEERVGCVEHHVRQGLAAARSQLPRRLVAHEAQVRHGLFDPVSRRGADSVGPVENVGHRAQGNPGRQRCILDSLALAYRRHVKQASSLAGREVTVVHVVGGGARNDFLCQLTADACGLPVVAGPAEASALGNVLVQARALGVGLLDLAAMRDLVRATQPLVRYNPGHAGVAAAEWDRAAARLARASTTSSSPSPERRS